MPLYPAKQKLQAGQAVFGTMLTECLRPEVVPALAACGLDFFLVDTEHSPGDLHEIEALARAGRQFGVAPLVRIAENEFHLIGRAMDCGAVGIVVPRIRSAADARRVVDAVKYPPLGRRGFGIRGTVSDFAPLNPAEAIARGNLESIAVVQVETAEALDDLENIVLVPGLDATMIGPFDLSLALGIPGQFAHQKMNAAFRRVAEVCGRSPVAPGTYMQDLSRLIELKAAGFRFLVLASDLDLMMKALKDAMDGLRGAG